MESKIEEGLKTAVETIVRTFDPEKVILFGSYAYGKPHKYSDVDLLIVMESNERPAQRRMMIGSLFRDRLFPMDFIVKTPSEVEKRICMGDFFIKKILEKGKVLYERKTG